MSDHQIQNHPEAQGDADHETSLRASKTNHHKPMCDVTKTCQSFDTLQSMKETSRWMYETLQPVKS